MNFVGLLLVPILAFAAPSTHAPASHTPPPAKAVVLQPPPSYVPQDCRKLADRAGVANRVITPESLGAFFTQAVRDHEGKRATEMHKVAILKALVDVTSCVNGLHLTP